MKKRSIELWSVMLAIELKRLEAITASSLIAKANNVLLSLTCKLELSFEFAHCKLELSFEFAHAQQNQVNLDSAFAYLQTSNLSNE